MEHHIARDLLGAFVEDDLEADTKTELEQHLADCDQCRALLEEAAAPLDLTTAGDKGKLAWDETRMRRTVRRTLFRVVSGAIAIWLIGLVLLAAISALAFQPLVVDRGDRAQTTGIATWDLPVLVTPGASVDTWTSEATLFGRDLSVEIVRFVGGESQPLGIFETDLGMFSFGQRGFDTFNPYVGGDSRRFVSDRLPEGTVVTVQLLWLEQPISIANAEALRPDPAEAVVLWAGFDVSPALPQGSDRFPGDSGSMLGYHTCETPTILDLQESFFSSGFATSGGNVTGCFFQPSSVAQALEQTRRATHNLASDTDVIEALEASPSEALQNIETVASWIAVNQPAVTALVITGPTRNVTQIVETSGADDAIQLDVDFWNWPTS